MMTWNDCFCAVGVPRDHVEISSANTACANSNEHLIPDWLRTGIFAVPQ